MGRVSVRAVFPASVHEAQRCWCEVERWPEWVDGLARVVAVEGPWPRAGASVTWQSNPAGRGLVRERVEEYEPRRRLVLAGEDDTMTALQEVSFEPLPDGVAVELSLGYTIKRRSPLTPVLDRLFVRRPMIISLSKTLERFGEVLAESRRTDVG